MRLRTAALVGACGVLPGALIGVAVRLAAAESLPEERASAAVVVVLGLAAALGPSAVLFERARAPLVPAAAGLAAMAAAVVTGSPSGALGAGLVTSGAAALGVGCATLQHRVRCARSSAALAGVVLPALLCASVLLADPFVEWNGSSPRSTVLARWIYRTNAVAAVTSPDGGTGVDWQTRSLLYDGHGAGGLSVIGQYYPSRPPSAPIWGISALLAGGLLAMASRERGAREA